MKLKENLSIWQRICLRFDTMMADFFENLRWTLDRKRCPYGYRCDGFRLSSDPCRYESFRNGRNGRCGSFFVYLEKEESSCR